MKNLKKALQISTIILLSASIGYQKPYSINASYVEQKILEKNSTPIIRDITREEWLKKVAKEENISLEEAEILDEQ